MRTAMLLAISALALASLPHGAAATTPDPAHCTADPVMSGTSTGAAITLHNADHAGFRVIIRDSNGQPIANTAVKVWVAAGGGGGTCPNDFYSTQVSGTTINCLDTNLGNYNETISKNTDASGAVIFTPRLGGHNGAYECSAYVTCQGMTVVDHIATRSTDIDDDGKTGLVDLSAFAAVYNSGSYDEYYDFDNDGVVGLNDFSIIANQYGAGTFTICNAQ